MQEITVELGERSYPIIIGEGASDRLPVKPEKKRRLWVFDRNTFELYGHIAGHSDAVYTFGHGEADKNFENMIGICRAAVAAGLDRSSEFIAVGGGVTGDMTGFAAGIYQRGIPFIQMPTSLLAMVDSSVGGKTAVDLPEGKNLVGVFHQPKMVLIDTAFLKTLPDRELQCGMAEVIKMAAGFDPEFFCRLEKAGKRLAGGTDFAGLADEIIARCCELKAIVVKQDEREGASGIRAQLNFGHTFGHAIEALSNFSCSHGAGVAIGMVLAGITAEKCGLWSRAEQQRLTALLKAAGLPLQPPAALDFSDVLAFMRRDKKNSGGAVNLILPEKIGKLKLVKDIPENLLEESWNQVMAGEL